VRIGANEEINDEVNGEDVKEREEGTETVECEGDVNNDWASEEGGGKEPVALCAGNNLERRGRRGGRIKEESK